MRDGDLALRVRLEHGNTNDHLAISKHLGAGQGSRDYPAVEVVWTLSDHATLADGGSRASAYFAKYPQPTAAVHPPTYEKRREVHVDFVIWPLMGASAPVDPEVFVEYINRTTSAAEEVIDEPEEEEKAAEECDEW